MMDASMSGISGMDVHQQLNFDTEIKPLVEEKRQSRIHKVEELEKELEALHADIAAATLEHSRASDSLNQQKRKSTSRLDAEYQSKESTELVEHHARLEQEVTQLEAEQKKFNITLKELSEEEKEHIFALEQVEVIRQENEEEFKGQIQEVYELMRSSMQDVVDYKR